MPTPASRPAPAAPAVGLAVGLLGLAAVPAGAAPAFPVPSSPAVPADTTAVLTGRVVLTDVGAPAAAARVELAVRERSTVTDSLGRFRLEGLAPGADTLRVSTLEGRSERRAVRLEAGAETEVEVELDPRVVDVGGLEVTVEGPRRTELERLAGRIEEGAGQYITRDELAEHEGRLSGAFRGVLGTRVAYVPGGDFRVLLTAGRGECVPELFLNGTRQPGVPVNAYSPEEVAAVEVYEANLVPGEFRTARARSCGAILLWTRNFVR